MLAFLSCMSFQFISVEFIVCMLVFVQISPTHVKGTNGSLLQIAGCIGILGALVAGLPVAHVAGWYIPNLIIMCLNLQKEIFLRYDILQHIIPSLVGVDVVGLTTCNIQ